MDVNVSKSLLRRQDVRSVTAGLGVFVTLSLFVALTREADHQSAYTLEQTHQATLRLLSRDIDDLRQQLVRAAGLVATGTTGAEEPYQTLLFRRDSKGTIGVQDGRMISASVPIENAGTSLFRASLPSHSKVYAEILADSSDPLDRTPIETPTTSLITASSRIDGTNLTLSSKLSLLSARSLANWLVGGSGIFWMLLTYAAHRWETARRRRLLQAQAWMENAMVDFRFGRLPMPAENLLLDTPEGALVGQLSETLSNDMPYFVGISNRMIDTTTRLGSWDMFQTKFNTLLMDLSHDERFVIGKLHFAAGTSTKQVVSGMAQELALTGEYIQCMYSDTTLVFAFRTEGPDNLLYGVFSPLRHLVDTNVLKPGQFEATLFVLNNRSSYQSSQALLDKLSPNHSPAFASRNPAIPATLAPHLILQEGMPTPKITIFSLIQLLYLDGHMLNAGKSVSPHLALADQRQAQALLAEENSEEMADEPATVEITTDASPKRRGRKPRKTLGRTPTLPPLPAPENWN
ncbi:MAG: hypothetical protein EOP11_03610 [Proteobacteria bacterium]|nr:MAG: hypothetical protein EOP11_03610 [Pseudomonadota bacterium]